MDLVAKPYIKLDCDWMHDPKIILFRSKYGKAALVDVLTVFILMSEMGGIVDLSDEASMLKARQELGKSKKAVYELVDRMAECGIVSKESWEILRKVGSERSIKDATAKANRRNYAIEASKAAKAARDAKAKEQSKTP